MQEAEDPLAEAGTTTAPPTETGATGRRRFTPRSRSSGTSAVAWSARPSTCPSTTRIPTASRSSCTWPARRPAAIGRVPCSSTRADRVRAPPSTPSCSPYVLPEEITEHFDIVGRRPARRRRQHADHLRDPRRGAVRRRPDLRGRRGQGGLPAVSEAYVEDCAAKYGDVLPHVGTPDVARDMDVVRAAMGDEQLSYLGFSYGTVIGQVYADLFPERVRSMVLDGVVELGPDRARDRRRAGGRLRDWPWIGSWSTATRPRDAPRRATRSPRSRRCSPSPRSPAASRPRTPTARPVRARRTWGSATACTPQSLWNDLADALADALDGDGSRARRAGRRLPRHRRLRDLLRA